MTEPELLGDHDAETKLRSIFSALQRATWRGVLGALTPESRRALFERGALARYRPDRVLYTQGTQNPHVWLLLTGSVKVTAASSGDHTRQILLEIRTGGDLLGEREVLAHQIFSASQRSLNLSSARVTVAATAATVSDVTALTVSIDEFARLAAKSPDVSQAIACDLEQRLSAAQVRLGTVSSENANRRLARALLSLSMTTDASDRESGWLYLNQAELASWIGASRAAVERILRDWRARAIVTTSYRRVLILKLGDLKRIAGAPQVSRPEVAAPLRGLR
jgi:CRP/FNR family transcriptional regulator, cyclic AMP receptor protein